MKMIKTAVADKVNKQHSDLSLYPVSKRKEIQYMLFFLHEKNYFLALSKYAVQLELHPKVKSKKN